MTGETTDMAPTVFIVDDDDAVRDALSMLLDSFGLAVETFASANDFLERWDDSRPGCLVLDVRMPEMDGLDLQQFLNARSLQLPIIFITGHGDVPMSVKAIKGGAVDFLEKPADDDVLLDRIRLALEQDARQRREAERLACIYERYVRLTPREREVMSLIVAGESNKAIARQLEVSFRTVEIHRARIMQKMEAASLPELVTLASECERAFEQNTPAGA